MTMTRKTKFLGSTTGLLAAAAFSGLLAGASHASAATTQKNMAAKTTLVAKAGVKANTLDAGTHSCSGKGGCKVAATQPSL
jgi:hypothetical protein